MTAGALITLLAENVRPGTDRRGLDTGASAAQDDLRRLLVASGPEAVDSLTAMLRPEQGVWLG